MKGTVSNWNAERGFGFIRRRKAADEVFFHVSELKSLRVPIVGDGVVFSLGRDGRGRVCACGVTFADNRGIRFRGLLKYLKHSFVISVLAALTISVRLGLQPLSFLVTVLVLSLVTFVLYAWDKGQARRGGWRTSETVLHLWALAGGWPGAMMAQEKLRHKSRKLSFQVVFWATVLLNLGVVFWLFTPEGGRLIWWLDGQIREYAVLIYEILDQLFSKLAGEY